MERISRQSENFTQQISEEQLDVDTETQIAGEDGELITPDTYFDSQGEAMTREAFERGVEAILNQVESDFEEAKDAFFDTIRQNPDYKKVSWGRSGSAIEIMRNEAKGKSIFPLTLSPTLEDVVSTRLWEQVRTDLICLHPLARNKVYPRLVILAQEAGILPVRAFDPDAPKFSPGEWLFLGKLFAVRMWRQTREKLASFKGEQAYVHKQREKEKKERFQQEQEKISEIISKQKRS